MDKVPGILQRKRRQGSMGLVVEHKSLQLVDTLGNLDIVVVVRLHFVVAAMEEEVGVPFLELEAPRMEQ
jgi:polysaccharide pyruvyl transferase WcaK-like protein